MLYLSGVTISYVEVWGSEERIVIYLLGEPEDSDLLWLAVALQRRGEQVEFVLPEELLIGSALTCRIDKTGVVSSLRLRDGREFEVGTPGLVVNGKLKHAGKPLPNIDKVKALIKEEA